MSTVKKNFVYNLIYQLLIFIFPLITIPYVSRILGKDGVGIYSYTHSIVNYFMLITLLGINNHGNRSIAKTRGDKNELSKTFFSIYIIQLLSGLLMIMMYILYMVFLNRQYTDIAWIQILFILSAVFDINWFFFGLEEFKITIARSTLVKIISLILIFLFVRTSNDVAIYALIMALSTLISQLLLIPFLIKRISLVRININDIKKHIKYVLLLFVPVIAVSVYRVMDKIMIGLLSSVDEVGLYEQSDKIILVPCTIITALGTVMLPRISNLVANDKRNEILKYIYNSIKFVMFLSFPMCLGLIAVSNTFVPMFLGHSFIDAIFLVKCMSITILFASFANVLRTQYLIPYEKDKIYMCSILLGAFSNLICNIIFIPKFGAKGALIGTILAEFLVMLYQTVSVRKELPIKKYISNIIPFLLKALIMFTAIYLFNYIGMNRVLRLLIQVLLGSLIYGLLNTKYILSIINIKKIFKRRLKHEN